MFYSQGGEDSTVFNHFFSQPLKCGGTFVEMGALDGLTLSVSLFFERHLNWKGLLIEANPLNYELVVKNRPNTTSLELQLELVQVEQSILLVRED